MNQNKTEIDDHQIKGTNRKHLKADRHDNINYIASTVGFRKR